MKVQGFKKAFVQCADSIVGPVTVSAVARSERLGWVECIRLGRVSLTTTIDLDACHVASINVHWRALIMPRFRGTR